MTHQNPICLVLLLLDRRHKCLTYRQWYVTDATTAAVTEQLNSLPEFQYKILTTKVTVISTSMDANKLYFSFLPISQLHEH